MWYACWALRFLFTLTFTDCFTLALTHQLRLACQMLYAHWHMGCWALCSMVRRWVLSRCCPGTIPPQGPPTRRCNSLRLSCSRRTGGGWATTSSHSPCVPLAIFVVFIELLLLRSMHTALAEDMLARAANPATSLGPIRETGDERGSGISRRYVGAFPRGSC